MSNFILLLLNEEFDPAIHFRMKCDIGVIGSEERKRSNSAVKANKNN